MVRWRLLAAMAGVLLWPGAACAAAGGPAMPIWTVAPFVLMLLAIALLPLAAEHFWHSNFNKGLVAVACGAPVAAYLILREQMTGDATTAMLLHGLQEYAQFITLLAALYVVAGGIRIEGSWYPNPFANTLVLAIGAVLANVIGTTGASMLLIRLFLRINQGRYFKSHLPIFFIFIVSNLAGLLTPLGDPPLFLGFLQGVDFFWTLQLWPQWLLANGMVLGVFLVVDAITIWREHGKVPHVATEPVRVRGLINLVFLAGILAAVLLQSTKIAGLLTDVAGRFGDCPSLLLVFPHGEMVMAAMALLSLLLTPHGLRLANSFSWHAILEVAVLFVGIFITMQPALALVAAHGPAFGVSEPWQYFWLTGSLSAVLDNAPTYLTFATLASEGNELTGLQTLRGGLILQAISCGAVFMGAMTYIGNGPNFMVKAIADRSGYDTPSFFGYLLYSVLILLPVFGVVTWLFFPP